MLATERPPNLYDNAKIDVATLYEKQEQPLVRQKNPLRALYRLSFLPIKLRKYIWLLFSQTNVDLFWFIDFKRYWSRYLGLRPLWGVEDFYFLRNWYRIGFQYAEVADSTDVKKHVEVWQGPAILFFLLQQVYVESKYRNFDLLELTKKHLKKKNPRYLEYGSGIGPATQTFMDFDAAFEKSTFYLADIKTIAFHYATKRFGGLRNVNVLPLEESTNLQLTGIDLVDCVFCITVFEHLNAPLETVRRFHRILPQGGLLFFDYIKGDGQGLDTQAGVRERRKVLDFVRENFEILYTLDGEMDPERSLGLTVVRKL